MIKTINEYDFVNEFRNSSRSNSFSYDGLKALFSFLEDCTSEAFELDVIAIDCDFTEYESLKDFQDDYGTEYETIEDIENETTVIMVDGESFIIQNF